MAWQRLSATGAAVDAPDHNHPMASSVTRFAEQFVNPAREVEQLDDGVEGNTRLTAALGALLFVAFAVEGVTLLIGVREMFVVHVFVGFLVVPPVLAKVGSTGYRMARYYSGNERFRRKGPPHPILRVLGPLVVLSTVALVGTGVAMIVVGAKRSDNLRDLHSTSFIVWVILMSIHVLGHLVETGRSTADDWAPGGPRVARATLRRGVVVGSLLLGLGLGALSIGWAHTWRTASDSQRREFGVRRHRDD